MVRKLFKIVLSTIFIGVIEFFIGIGFGNNDLWEKTNEKLGGSKE